MDFPSGRFAPSPTGDLHLGSLVAAAGSFLDARAAGARWLVRMEDLDRPRVIAGSADRILATLEAFGFEWDGAIVRQSERQELYRDALERLRAAGLTFECSCSRREIAEMATPGGRYPGVCRAGPAGPGPTATRYRVDEAEVAFDDRLQGPQRYALGKLGDFVLQRRDGIYAYHLAVVVDDADQAITSVVRGADLLSSTPWQIALQQALALPTPRYAHLPLVTEADGSKLAKSRRSIPLDPSRAGRLLAHALAILRHPPPPDLEGAPSRTLLDWAVREWQPARLRGVRAVALSSRAPADTPDLGAKRSLY